METTNPNMAAVAELDRLQAAMVDAIWDEHRIEGPNGDKAREVVAHAEEYGEDPEHTMAKLKELIGANSTSDVVRYSLNVAVAGSKRARAVEAYLFLRQTLTNAGIL